MIIGNTNKLALEFEITKAYEQLSQLALGFFVIYVSGRRYGVREPEATLLAASLDAVKRRIVSRGKHTVPFDPESSAGDIADAYLAATYDEDRQAERFFGMSGDSFRDALVSKDVVWAPDGDSAFDDGGHILQFDIGVRVRVIGFRNADEKTEISRDVSDIWIGADEFYGLLIQWQSAFDQSWADAIRRTRIF
jgi:Immunity protein 42